MICINKKCKAEIPEYSSFCPYCGKKQSEQQSKYRKRPNGTGTVTMRPDGKYRATVTLGWTLVPSSIPGSVPKKTRKTMSKVFATKKEALLALPQMLAEHEKKDEKIITFKGLYDLWLPTHRAGKSTLGNYKAAVKYFSPVFDLKMQEIEVEDLQDCMDSCPKGKRTRENMKALCGLVYKYGIPRNYVPKDRNLSTYLVVEGECGIPRLSFDENQIGLIKGQIGKTYGADYIYCLCYLGFRPTEFLSLKKENYDRKRQIIVSGGKTEAGRNRTVTVSPKIQPYLESMVKRSEEYLVVNPNGKPYDKDSFPEVMYAVLDAAGIDNPMIMSAGRMIHTYTPHSCRHTFATLMKRVQASSKDKQELIGHASEEMLRYYQDVSLDDLRNITNQI